jgi:hypothetical protein
LLLTFHFREAKERKKDKAAAKKVATGKAKPAAKKDIPKSKTQQAKQPKAAAKGNKTR